MTVYAAGYARTRDAAERLAEAERQRPPIPAPSDAGPQLPPPEPPPDLALRSAPSPAATTPTATRAATAPAARSESASARASSPAATAPRTEARSGVVAVTAPVNGDASRSVPPQADVAATESAAAAIAQTSAPATDSALTEPARPADAIATPATPKVLYHDGTYTGYGTSRHGDIEATLIIAGGRITSAEISKCYTRWPCSWIKLLPPQVVQIQSPEVDFITGATVSTYAFYYAVIDALNKAK